MSAPSAPTRSSSPSDHASVGPVVAVADGVWRTGDVPVASRRGAATTGRQGRGAADDHRRGEAGGADDEPAASYGLIATAGGERAGDVESGVGSVAELGVEPFDEVLHRVASGCVWVDGPS